MTNLDPANCPYLRLPFDFDPQRLQADLQSALGEQWTPHFNRDYYHGDWSGLALRAVKGAADPLHSNEQHPPESFADAPVLDRCEYFRAALATFQCPLKAVRLLRLKAGSIIREHSDGDLGYDRGEIRIHIPIVTNPAVEFYLGGERIVLNEGECWYLDLSRLHRVQNLGATDRVHLVVDCALSDWMRSVLSTAAATAVPISDKPRSLAANLEGFKELVLEDSALLAQLRPITNMEEFLRQTVRLGEANGFRFTVEDVRSALQANRRAWIERWV
jgi:Aspartyl/Asparaginyl beta-hydroxylase/Nif11 domain